MITTATQGAAVFIAGAFGAAVVSNRVQRRIRTVAAAALCRLWFRRRDAHQSQLASLDRIRTLPELIERLPYITVSVAGVDPVTLYMLDPDSNQYVPVSSTLLPPPTAAVGADEPLAKTLQKSRRVRHLRSRPDDLQNAPIYAVNGRHLEESRAACALPLRPNGTLAGFLLIGGTDGSHRLGLLSNGCLEGLGLQCTDLMRRFKEVDIMPGRVLIRYPKPERKAMTAARSLEDLDDLAAAANGSSFSTSSDRRGSAHREPVTQGVA